MKSFSPAVEEHVKQIFNDEYGECKFYATIPAMVRHNGRILIVQRIWLGQYEKMSSHYKRTGATFDEQFQVDVVSLAPLLSQW